MEIPGIFLHMIKSGWCFDYARERFPSSGTHSLVSRRIHSFIHSFTHFSARPRSRAASFERYARRVVERTISTPFPTRQRSHRRRVGVRLESRERTGGRRALPQRAFFQLDFTARLATRANPHGDDGDASDGDGALERRTTNHRSNFGVAGATCRCCRRRRDRWSDDAIHCG